MLEVAGDLHQARLNLKTLWLVMIDMCINQITTFSMSPSLVKAETNVWENSKADQ